MSRVLDATGKSRLRAKLERSCSGEFVEDASSLEAFERDFGGIVRRAPAMVFRPARLDDLVLALKVAAAHGIPVATRGSGHGQSGQSLGDGLVLDMRSLDRVIAIDEGRQVLEVEAGATWRRVLDATVARGLLPVAPTHALDPTVGGTLSVAGVGAESFRFGAQVDQILSMDVATLDGRIVRASLEERRDLFDSVRAGFGQCGVMLRVRYPLRPVGAVVTTHPYVFRSAAGLLEAVKHLGEDDPRVRFLTAVLAADPWGSERGVLLLYAGRDHGARETPEALPDLGADVALPSRSAATWCESTRPAHPFFRAFEDDVELAAGVNPWLEYLLPSTTAEVALERLLERTRELLEWGRVGVIFVRRPERSAPLFVSPKADLGVGIGLFVSAPEANRADVLQWIHTEDAWLGRLAGSRYLSGYFSDTSSRVWAEHYAGAWDAFRSAKREFDSRGLLNPGFIHFD